ncbi:hypothetical protein A2389_00890 [Candidatus Adlerbacteria bacterium RIFOXYB1_FULL_48_10]|nr:MAG: hypothetical protein A2389_00890 [Candidatus Adlerbacteria bacterium RIFOXYB1_FULL_48_10]
MFALLKKATPFQTNQKILEEMPWLWAVSPQWDGEEVFISRIGEGFEDHPLYLGITYALYFHYKNEWMETVKRIELPKPYLTNGREVVMWDVLDADEGYIGLRWLEHIVLVEAKDGGEDFKYFVFQPKRGTAFSAMWENNWRYKEADENRRAARRLAGTA